MIVISEKVYYDFTLSSDILFKNQGVGGIIFRMRDEFNYYAFIIDKNLGQKAIVKVQNSRVIILKMINDGGIIINNWHTVTITVKAGLISVYMYDKEKASKSESEKKIVAEDFTFSNGTAGFFVNGLAGFYFDEFTVKPIECFSPWQPKPQIEIHNSNTNIYIEDFSGNIRDKYTIIEIEETYIREGPSDWIIINDYVNFSIIRQTSLVYDSSASKRPSIALINYVNFQNGIFKVVYNPSEAIGMVSIILKYYREEDETLPTKEDFFSFDIVNDETESYFTFRKWNNGAVNVINRTVIDKNTSKLLKLDISKAYIANQDNWVIVEFINQKITVKISQNGIDFGMVFNLVDESFRAGAVGFGTYKTRCDFRSINVDSIFIKLTQNDIEFIMTHTVKYILLPSVIQIQQIGITSPCCRNNNYTQVSAFNTVMAYITILGSTLGNDYSGSSSSNVNINVNIDETVIVNEKLISISEGNQWKTCVVNRSQEDRQKYCNEKFDSDLIKKRCEVNYIIIFIFEFSFLLLL
jgi:hypothetical protein